MKKIIISLFSLLLVANANGQELLNKNLNFSTSETQIVEWSIEGAKINEEARTSSKEGCKFNIEGDLISFKRGNDLIYEYKINSREYKESLDSYIYKTDKFRIQLLPSHFISIKPLNAFSQKKFKEEIFSPVNNLLVE